MKKALKIFGLALLAGAVMFTACKKDEEDTTKKTNNTENNGGNNNTADTVASIGMEFDGEPAHLGFYQAVVDDSINPYIFSFVGVGVDEEGKYTLPQLQITLNYDAEAASEQKWSIPVFYYTADADHFAALKNKAVQEHASQIAPEWVAKEVNAFAFSKFETSPVILSFEADVTMQSNYEYSIESTPENLLTTKDLLLVAKNIRFANGSLRR